jgi:hypothetical protein
MSFFFRYKYVSPRQTESAPATGLLSLPRLCLTMDVTAAGPAFAVGEVIGALGALLALFLVGRALWRRATASDDAAEE